jgi:hypothetical protein
MNLRYRPPLSLKVVNDSCPILLDALLSMADVTQEQVGTDGGWQRGISVRC